MQMLEELYPFSTVCLEQGLGSIEGNAAVFRLDHVILEFDPRIVIEPLAGGHIEVQGGEVEIICDEEFFDLILEEFGHSTAYCPQLRTIAGSLP